jgi:hypothetical protein
MTQNGFLKRWFQGRNPADVVQPRCLLDHYEMGTRLARTRLIHQAQGVQAGLALISPMVDDEFSCDNEIKTGAQPSQVTFPFLHKVYLVGGVTIVTFLMTMAAVFVIRLGRVIF